MEAANAIVDQLHRQLWQQTNNTADLLAGMDNGVGAVSDWQREIVRIERTLTEIETRLERARSADPPSSTAPARLSSKPAARWHKLEPTPTSLR